MGPHGGDQIVIDRDGDVIGEEAHLPGAGIIADPRSVDVLEDAPGIEGGQGVLVGGELAVELVVGPAAEAPVRALEEDRKGRLGEGLLPLGGIEGPEIQVRVGEARKGLLKCGPAFTAEGKDPFTALIEGVALFAEVICIILATAK